MVMGVEVRAAAAAAGGGGGVGVVERVARVPQPQGMLFLFRGEGEGDNNQEGRESGATGSNGNVSSGCSPLVARETGGGFGIGDGHTPSHTTHGGQRSVARCARGFGPEGGSSSGMDERSNAGRANGL